MLLIFISYDFSSCYKKRKKAKNSLWGTQIFNSKQVTQRQLENLHSKDLFYYSQNIFVL